MKRWFASILTLGLVGCNNPLAGLFGDSRLTPLPFMPHLTYKVAASPDGQKIAYSEPAGLFVVEVGASMPRKVADSSAPIMTIAWSGDGGQILFAEQTTSKGNVLTLATGETRPSPLEIDQYGSLQPSPDGKYWAQASQRGIKLYEIATGKVSSLRGGTGWRHFAWSPDSTRIAYLELEPSANDAALVIMTISDGAVTRAEKVGFHRNRMGVEMSCWPEEEKFTWASESDAVQLVQNRDRNSFAVTKFGLDGKLRDERVVNVADPADARRYVDCYHPSPDGRYVVALKISGEGGIPEPSTSSIGVDLTTGKVKDAAPPSTFVAWLGKTGRFIISNNQNSRGENQYFTADAR